MGAKPFCNGHGIVRRQRIDDDDLIGDAFQGLNAAGNIRGFIKGDYDGTDGHVRKFTPVPASAVCVRPYLRYMKLASLLPTAAGIPVLTYRRVWPNVQDSQTVTPQSLRAQWSFLRDEGYECLPMDRFLAILRAEEPAPKKAFVLTFDDGYYNNLTQALPLLREFGWEATVFISAGVLDGSYPLDVDSGPARRMGTEELREIAGPNMRIGLHGYRHENFSGKKLDALEAIIRKSAELLEEAGIPFAKVLAYPYGARPSDRLELQVLKAWMSNFGIEAAFRIGNRLQRAPALDLYEVNRVEIRGEDTLDDFQLKVKRGRATVF